MSTHTPMDALDLDHSYCARCETYIWPEKRQVQVDVPAKAQSGSKATQAKAASESDKGTVTKIRTVISLDRTPLYCSERCRRDDFESGSDNARRIKQHFRASPSSSSPSPVSPRHDQAAANSDYFSRLAGGLPWARRSSTTSTRSTTSMSSFELLEEHRQWSRTLLAESADRLSRSESRAAISAESTTLPKLKPKLEPKPREQQDAPAPIPFTHRRWKEPTARAAPTPSRSVHVDVAALYDSYPMSQRVRSSTSSFGSGSSVRPGSMTASTVSDTASIRTSSSRGSATRRQFTGLSPEATRGLLVPAVMIRDNDATSPSRSTHSISDDGEDDAYFPVSRNRTITQRSHSHSSKKSKSIDRTQKTIRDLVREVAGPEYGSRPASWSSKDQHLGPLYEIPRTPPGPVKRHVVHEIDVGGKTERRIVEEDHWEEPQQKMFHFTN